RSPLSAASICPPTGAGSFCFKKPRTVSTACLAWASEMPALLDTSLINSSMGMCLLSVGIEWAYSTTQCSPAQSAARRHPRLRVGQRPLLADLVVYLVIIAVVFAAIPVGEGDVREKAAAALRNRDAILGAVQ